MIKVLVTGANGQLGQSFRYWASRFPKFEFTFSDLPELDLTNDLQLTHYFEKNTTDYVFNCAAYTEVDKAEEEIVLAHKLNELAVEKLCELAKKHRFRLVHFSTDYVFDGTNENPYKETHPHAPQSIYGASKSKGERALLNADIDAWIVRTSWLFSPYGKNFVKTIFSLLQNKTEINIVADQTGAPTYAIDLAKSVLEAVAQRSFGKGASVYHITNEGNTTWHEFATKIKELINADCEVKPVTTEDYPTLAKRPKYSVLSNEKFKKEFKIKSRSWEWVLADCLKKIKSES
jgi:dTDP-4-dehydrorhamnose reductase